MQVVLFDCHVPCRGQLLRMVLENIAAEHEGLKGEKAEVGGLVDSLSRLM